MMAVVSFVHVAAIREAHLADLPSSEPRRAHLRLTPTFGVRAQLPRARPIVVLAIHGGRLPGQRREGEGARRRVGVSPALRQLRMMSNVSGVSWVMVRALSLVVVAA